ncbi:MAG: Fe2+-dependent dioxygenase [Alphaproteobacteria bacterium]
MLVQVPQVLTKEEVAYCRRRLKEEEWVDGRITAGDQSAKAKFNLQIPEDSPVARELGELILQALGRNALFTTAALPLRVFPPLFNRYDAGMVFNPHIDNAIRPVRGGGGRIRTDVSSTLFLSEPDEYDGGELVVEDTFGDRKVKLPAGDMILYPAISLHYVKAVTRGSRRASFFWTQSMVKDDNRRRLLFEMDIAIIRVRQSLSDDHPGVLGMTACYHNLLRQWSDL